MTIQTHFNKFNSKIYLTNQSDGYKKASEKDKGILEELKKAFRDADCEIIDTFCQGSFAVNTAIESLQGDYDIDRALVVDSEKAPTDPVSLKQLIRDVLSKRNFKDPKIKKPCVTADYTSRNLHIDYTVYSYDGYSYKLAVGKEFSSEKEWSESDTKGLINWIDDKSAYGEDKTNKGKQFKRLVRYMKRWRDVNFSDDAVRKKVFSIGITVMLKEQYKPNPFAESVDDDLSELKSTIDRILNSGYLCEELNGYRLHVRLPKAPNRDIFHHKVSIGGISYSKDGSDLNVGNQFKNKLTRLQSELQKALDETDEIKQCEILNKVFGDDFEVPSSKSESSRAAIAGGLSIFPNSGASGTSQGA